MSPDIVLAGLFGVNYKYLDVVLEEMEAIISATYITNNSKTKKSPNSTSDVVH